MKEILFKAWNARRKEMTNIYDYYWFEENYYHSPEENNDFIILKPTGLPDKNGVKIFEGNILKYIGNECEYCGSKIYYEGHKPYIVEWISEESCFETNSKDNYMAVETWGSSMEVIGNIYENPELLDG